MNTFQDMDAVTVGIDAAVTANHHVVVRRPEPGGVGGVVDEFTVAPTLDGLARLSRRLADRDVRLAVAEPTSMTWLGLSIALDEVGIDLALVGSRHVARLRGAVSGKNKSDVIDAQLLSRAGELFALRPATLPDAATLALQRACRRRHKLLIEANRCWRRIVALGRWAFPDTWNALGGSRAAILAVLRRWPHLETLSRARVGSITDEIAAHTRGVGDVTARATKVRDTARDWAAFWHGHLDLDALAWEVTDLLDELAELDARVAGAGAQATRWWQARDDELLLSVPGVGPTVAPTIRAFLGDGSRFPAAKHAASFVGTAPSNWSSGTVTQPSRAITKEGPPAMGSPLLPPPPGSSTDHPRPAPRRHRRPSPPHTRAAVHLGRHQQHPRAGPLRRHPSAAGNTRSSTTTAPAALSRRSPSIAPGSSVARRRATKHSR